MKANKQPVERDGTQYIEERVGRIRIQAYIHKVETKMIEIRDKLISKPYLNLYNITLTIDGETIEVPHTTFTYGQAFKSQRFTRNSKVSLLVTVWKLNKCKGKNAQKPGALVKYEFKYPKQFVVVEYNTNSKYRKNKPITKEKPQWEETVKV